MVSLWKHNKLEDGRRLQLNVQQRTLLKKAHWFLGEIWPWNRNQNLIIWNLTSGYSSYDIVNRVSMTIYREQVDSHAQE